MHSKLRSLFWLGLGLALATEASGALREQAPKARSWERLEPAMTMAQAQAILEPVQGAPLIVTRSRDGRFEVWTYDRGGQLTFIRGTLQYWTVAQESAKA